MDDDDDLCEYCGEHLVACDCDDYFDDLEYIDPWDAETEYYYEGEDDGEESGE